MVNNYDELYHEIQDIKEEIQNISTKVDQALQILSDFTIMLAESDEDDDNEFWKK